MIRGTHLGRIPTRQLPMRRRRPFSGRGEEGRGTDAAASPRQSRKALQGLVDPRGFASRRRLT